MNNKVLNGFSLIEMIVAVTVILILTGIGITNFSTVTSDRNLRSATNEMLVWINSARNLAATGQLPDETLGLKFVKVTVTGSGVTAVAIDDNDISKTFFSNKLTNSDSFTVSVNVGGTSTPSFGFNKATGRLLDENGNFINGPVRIVLNNGGSSVLVVDDLGVVNEE